MICSPVLVGSLWLCSAESQGETSGLASRPIFACHEHEETLPSDVQSQSTKHAAFSHHREPLTPLASGALNTC